MKKFLKKHYFQLKFFLSCHILNRNFFILPDFELNFFRRVTFQINFCTTRQILYQLFYNALDFEQFT